MLISLRRTRKLSAHQNSAAGGFRVAGWRDENDDSASEDLDEADKIEDIATANIFTNKNKRCVAKNHTPFILFLIQKVLSRNQRCVGTA